MQKKTRLSVFLMLFSALVLCSGCSSFFGGLKEREEIEYGSLLISGAQSRALDVAAVQSAKVTVSGSGIDSEISAECTEIVGGTGTFFIEKIPVGKNRIITVQAYDSTGNPIEGGIIRAVTDIDAGANVLETINWETTCRGNVYNALFEAGVEIGGLSEAQTALLESVIPVLDDVGGNVERIDSDSLVQDFSAGRLAGKTAENYILPGTPYVKRLYIAQSGASSVEKPVFTATAVFSDGTEKTVTEDAEWISSNENSASVSGGAVRLIAAGKTEIRAKYTEENRTRLSPCATVTVSVEEARKNCVYLDISGSVNYAKDGAEVAAWVWGPGLSSQWYTLEPVSGGGYLRLLLPSGAKELLIARGRSLDNEFSWGGLYPLWNQTVDLKIPADNKNTLSLKAADNGGWTGASGSWSYVDHGDRLTDYVYASVKMEPSEDDTSLASVKINGNSVAVSNRIVYTVPYDTETAEIACEPNYSGAAVSVVPSGALPVEKGGSVSFTVTVTAKDGNTESYLIKVKRSFVEPLDSDENKKRCYIEDSEEKTITFVYAPDVWNDTDEPTYAVTVRGSFTTVYNPYTKRWSEDEETYSLSYDALYGWYSLSLPYEKVARPGYSGQPEFLFYKNGRCLSVPPFARDENVFDGGEKTLMILFKSDDEARRAELLENSAAASRIKKLSDFNTASESDMRAVSNFRAVPGTTQLYRSYHPFYPTHTDTPAERLRIEQVQAFAQKCGIQSDINLCNNRTTKEGLPYTVGGVPYTVEIPDYYKKIIAADCVLYAGDAEHGGNGVVPSAKYVYYGSDLPLFGEWVKEIAEFIADEKHPAPFQIHCEIGVDRTGVFCAVLAGLCGARWEEIAADYTASNEMGIQEFRDVRILRYSLEKMLGVADIASVPDLKSALYTYFVNNGFVSHTVLDSMIQKLTSSR